MWPRSRRTMKRLILLVCTLSTLTGCVITPKVFTDFNQKQDFSTYKTFSWVSDSPALIAGDYTVSSLTSSRMTQAIRDKLVSMGYTFIEQPEQADFTLIYTIGARDKIKIREYPVHQNYYRKRHSETWGTQYYPYFERTNETVYEQIAVEYVQGEIAIDIFDGKNRQGVWHARASKRLSSTELKTNGENSRIVVDALLAEFPSNL